MSRVQSLVAQASALAAALFRVLVVLTLLGVLAAVAAGAGAAASDGWSSRGWVAGGVVAVGFLIAPWILGRYALDVRRIRALPEITAQQVTAAATQLGGRLREGQAALRETAGALRAWRVLRISQQLRSELLELADGGLAPAASLVQALVPIRLLVVGVTALLTPFLFAAALLLLAAGLAVG